MVDARSKVSDQTIPTLNRWVIIADGLARNGQYGDAAGVLLGAVNQDPVNSEAWLAMGNTLVAHADNTLTPASLYAYRRAVKADPKAPGPPFFLGLALAQQGRLIEARELWAGLVKRAPEDAPWREPIAVQVMRLDEAIAVQKGQIVAPSDNLATQIPSLKAQDEANKSEKATVRGEKQEQKLTSTVKDQDKIP